MLVTVPRDTDETVEPVLECHSGMLFESFCHVIASPVALENFFISRSFGCLGKRQALSHSSLCVKANSQSSGPSFRHKCNCGLRHNGSPQEFHDGVDQLNEVESDRVLLSHSSGMKARDASGSNRRGIVGDDRLELSYLKIPDAFLKLSVVLRHAAMVTSVIQPGSLPPRLDKAFGIGGILH